MYAVGHITHQLAFNGLFQSVVYVLGSKAAMAIELWAEKRAQLENGEIDAWEYEDWKASL